MAWQYSPEQVQRQAVMLANRVKKNYAKLRKRFKREHIDVFRLYDWDIPEIRAVVDWYAGYLVIAEYERTQTGPDWLPVMAESICRSLRAFSIAAVMVFFVDVCF
jgi:23S rRNA (cytosine1962-C5)-methyltransferase